MSKTPSKRALNKKTLTKNDVNEFFSILQGTISEIKTELLYTNTFTLLIAVMLSAQTTDKHVNHVTSAIFTYVNNPRDIINLGINWLMEKIKSINYYKTKAKNLYNASQKLVSDYNGIIPQTLDELVSLPGIGRKSANVILNVAFNMPVIAVDTHVFRVANRTGIVYEKNVFDTEKALMKIIPDHFKMNAHHMLILHGRYVCKAQNPNCQKCIVSHVCQKKIVNARTIG